MAELPPELNPKFGKLKSKKELVTGMVLRIPWPTTALDQDIGYKLCKVVSITKSGLPVIETPAGGRLEVSNLKEMYYVKGTPKDESVGNEVLFDSL